MPDNRREKGQIIETRYTGEAAGLLAYQAASEVRMTGDERSIEGYILKFDVWSVDLGGFSEIIRKGATSKTVKESDIRCTVNHDANLLLGRSAADTAEFYEDKVGCAFRCSIPETQGGKDLRISMGRGDIDGCSFGFRTIKDDWTENYSKRELLEIALIDGGPVTYPAYEDTEVHLRSAYSLRTARIQADLRVAGIEYEELVNAIISAKRSGAASDDERREIQETIDALKTFLDESEPEGHSDTETEPDRSTLYLVVRNRRRYKQLTISGART